MHKVIIFLCAIIAVGHAENCHSLVDNLKLLISDYDQKLGAFGERHAEHVNDEQQKRDSFADTIQNIPVHEYEDNQQCRKEFSDFNASLHFIEADKAINACKLDADKEFNQLLNNLLEFKKEADNFLTGAFKTKDISPVDYACNADVLSEGQKLLEEQQNNFRNKFKESKPLVGSMEKKLTQCVSAATRGAWNLYIQKLKAFEDCKKSNMSKLTA